jgi:hypothetical protein
MHIETEKKFYKMMNKKRSFLLSLIIAGFGFVYLYYQFFSIKICDKNELLFWPVILGFLFIIQTMIGYSIFEYERKKYTKN